MGAVVGIVDVGGLPTPNTPPDMGALNSPLAMLARELMADTTSIDQARQTDE